MSRIGPCFVRESGQNRSNCRSGIIAVREVASPLIVADADNDDEPELAAAAAAAVVAGFVDATPKITSATDASSCCSDVISITLVRSFTRLVDDCTQITER
jgi:hypothetical protein